MKDVTKMQREYEDTEFTQSLPPSPRLPRTLPATSTSPMKTEDARFYRSETDFYTSSKYINIPVSNIGSGLPTSRHRDTSGTTSNVQENRRKRLAGRKRKRPWSESVVDGLRSFIAFLFSNVGIVCLVVGYTIAGAFIFEAIEGSNERIRTGHPPVLAIRNNTAAKLWQLVSEENTFSETNWKAKVEAILRIYQAEIAKAVKNGYDGVDDLEENRKWGFAGAFLYSLTVITTIGYGNTCPKTMWGKVVTIIYAIFGMPLFLLYLSNIGDILARSFKWIYARCCLCRCRKRPRISSSLADEARSRGISPTKINTWQMVRLHGEHLDATSLDGTEDDSVRNASEDETDDDDDDEDDEYDPQRITVPLTLCLAIMVGYICAGAILFSEWEDWNFLDGSYFCFVSLSTIGFGDIVPGDKIYAGQDLELSSVFCSMYLMLGMALIAMCFNLMQEEVVAKIRSLTRSVKHILNCER